MLTERYALAVGQLINSINDNNCVVTNVLYKYINRLEVELAKDDSCNLAWSNKTVDMIDILDMYALEDGPPQREVNWPVSK